jgi:hypothetical protein
MPQLSLQGSGAMKADKHLLVPEAKPSAIKISGQSPLRFPAIPPAIRDIKGVARPQKRIFFS